MGKMKALNTHHPENFDRVVNEGMSRLLEERGLSFSNANKKQLGKSFCRFYMSEIACYLLPMSEDDIEDGICDGKNDLDVDFVFEHNRQFYIYQSKYAGQKTHLSRDQITSFFGIHARIADRKYLNANGNELLVDLLRNFDPKCEVYYTLITNDRLTDMHVAEFKKGLETPTLSFKKVSWDLKGISEIKDEHRRALSTDETIPQEVAIPVDKIQMDAPELNTEKVWAYLDVTDLIDPSQQYKSIICTIKGTVLRDL
ncbi:hypothetical protein MUP59_00525 [Candidatus Bathyarchaeota archaeon]|nr:hypothetical protein [Candidatus Bathyarchaeota archaeon]